MTIKKPFTYITVTIIVVIAAITSSRRLQQLAADPAQPKDCPPLLPLPSSSAATRIIQENYPATLPWIQQGGTINDASCLNRTHVQGIVKVQTVEDIQQALTYAQENDFKISIAGVKHSMGGHAFAPGALVLDMTSFNDIEVDEEQKTMTVQSGATWHDIQNVLHPRFAVKAMQSTDIFTVGGSISVNAHGMDHNTGALGQTIRSLRLMLPNGTIQTLSPTRNTELFNLVIGGYGLFGIILDAEIEITDNEIYEYHHQLVDYQDFPQIFNQTIAPDSSYGLMYGHLSTAPGKTFLREMILHTYQQPEESVEQENISPLGEVGNVKLRRFVLNLSKSGALAKKVKWFAEKNIEPLLAACTVNRNQAMKEGEACLVSRNEPMHDSVKYLQNNLPQETDILQEYYIPRHQFVPYIDAVREVLTTHDANLLNASVRIVHQEHNVLNYAPEDMYALVLYVNQKTNKNGVERMKKLTQDLIDTTLQHQGTFFLPYQLHYTPEQLKQSYPHAEQFFTAKAKYDPQELFTNTFYNTYN